MILATLFTIKAVQCTTTWWEWMAERKSRHLRNEALGEGTVKVLDVSEPTGPTSTSFEFREFLEMFEMLEPLRLLFEVRAAGNDEGM
mmetsp:Transcript_57813/g.108829  ORF Transcript_57813/g.108829 Transcript_57813/m.108829 type:complete len:87 (+) Transcript_57813:1-261(+)